MPIIQSTGGARVFWTVRLFTRYEDYAFLTELAERRGLDAAQLLDQIITDARNRQEEVDAENAAEGRELDPPF